MEKDNVSFVYENTKFNFRVAALIIKNNKVLLESCSSFFNLPGGRVKMGELSKDSLVRELEEEMGIVVKNVKLVQICENIFNWMEKIQHEILLVYKVEIEDDSPILQKDNFNCTDNLEKIFSWHNLDEVEKLKCLPTCIYNLAKRTDFDFVEQVLLLKIYKT